MTVHRAILKGLLAGSVATRNMFTANTVLSEGDTDQQLFESYIELIFDEIGPFLSSEWLGTTLEVQHLSGGVWFTDSEEPVTAFGSASGEYLANLVAAVLIGAVNGVHAHGRKFISGIAESSADGNSLATAAIAAFAAGAAVYVSQFTSLNGGILSPGIIVKGGTFHQFTSGWLSSLLGTMRRRKPGIGI